MDFKEIPENEEEMGERTELVVQASHQIGPPAEFIARMLHESGMLRPGEKWTLTMATSCGFHAEIEMRVFHMGRCDKNEDAEDVGPASESAIVMAHRSDGIKLPFPAPKLFRHHTLTTIPEKH